MGLCSSSLSEEEKSTQSDSTKLDRVLVTKQEEDNKVIKLLLLGTGESGKSTIFKQMQILYVEEGFTEYEKSTFRHVVRRNVVESMQTLLFGCEKFGLAFEGGESDRSAKFMMALDPLSAEFWVDEIVTHVKQLWLREPAIRKSYERRSELQLLDSASYFFENLDRIGRPEYTPDRNDILRARLRTSGIVERTFRINNVDFKFLDVGGQRNERRKWIHCFENVTAVIFVAAISEYDQKLYEDEKENRLMESIHVFDNITNNRYFQSSTMILFLNKKDLFEEKITRVPLSTCFPEYDGDNSYDHACNFIKEQFMAVNKDDNRLIFPHLTCATDTTNVSKVFEACKLTILSKNLQKLGLQ